MKKEVIKITSWWSCVGCLHHVLNECSDFLEEY